MCKNLGQEEKRLTLFIYQVTTFIRNQQDHAEKCYELKYMIV